MIKLSLNYCSAVSFQNLFDFHKYVSFELALKIEFTFKNSIHKCWPARGQYITISYKRTSDVSSRAFDMADCKINNKR